MRITETHDAAVMVIRDDGVMTRVVGVALVLPSVGAWVLLVRAAVYGDPGPSAMSVAGVLFASLVGVLLGLSMMLLSEEVWIDRRLRTVTARHRVLWWKGSVVKDLDDFECVQVVKVGHGRYVGWGAELRAKPGGRESGFTCAGGLHSETEAREIACLVGGFCGLPCCDSGAGVAMR